MNKFYLIIIFLLILFIYLNKKIPQLKGKMGESAVKILLNKLDKEKYKVINDVIFENKYENNKSSQIDHLVVSKYGIFCIETKNYKGLIYGGENSRQWTQNIYGKKYKFKNPIFQNYGHIKVIENLLLENSLSEIPIFSIIAFEKEAKLNIKAEKANIIKIPYIVDRIKDLSQEEVLNEDQVNKIYNLIMKEKLKDRSIKEHVKNIKERKELKKDLINRKICPKCGGNLILREGKYGKFYACTNFPKCRFTCDYKE